MFAVAIGALGIASAASWFGEQGQREVASSQFPFVARGADLWWANEFGYRESVEFRCVNERFLDDRQRDPELGCTLAAGSENLSDGVVITNLGEAAPANPTAFIVAIRTATSCEDALVDANSTAVRDITGIGTGGNTWDVFLNDDLSVQWTLRLDPGRMSGELRHRDVHTPDDFGIPWSPPVTRSSPTEALFDDMMWMGYGGEEVHAAADMQYGQAARSCLGQMG